MDPLDVMTCPLQLVLDVSPALPATATAAHCEGKGSSLLEHHPYGVPHVLGKSVVTALVGVRDAFGSDFLDEATHPMLAPAWLAPDPVNVG